MRKAAKWVRIIGGFGLIVLGLGGIPDDVSTWASWLSWLDGETGRWLFVCIGLGSLATLVLWPTLKTRARKTLPKSSEVNDTSPRVTLLHEVPRPQDGVDSSFLEALEDERLWNGIDARRTERRRESARIESRLRELAADVSALLSERSEQSIRRWNDEPHPGFDKRTIEIFREKYDGAIQETLDGINAKTQPHEEISYESPDNIDAIRNVVRRLEWLADGVHERMIPLG